MLYDEGERLEILANVVTNKKGTFKDYFEKLKKDGYFGWFVGNAFDNCC